MKNRLLKTKLSGMALAFFVSLTVPQVIQANELQRLAENLCDYAKNNNRSSMRKKLKSARMRLKQIYPGLICGSAGSLMRVAVANDSIDAAKYIATKAGKKALSASEKDGKTALEFAENLVASGDASKQPFVDLIQSKL